MNKRVAYALVKLPSGKLLKRYVIEFNAQGTPLHYYPLSEEMPFTEWRNEMFSY